MKGLLQRNVVSPLSINGFASWLCCPLCKNELGERDGGLLCRTCGRSFPIVLGIPDLRIYEDPLIPLRDDYHKGKKIQVQAEKLSFAELVRYYWSLPTYPPTPRELSERFIEHVLTDETRITGYLGKLGTGNTFLDVGCGAGALVKVASAHFSLAVGCDVAFRWLLIARKRLQEAGLPVNLVCCCADYLPFKSSSFDSISAISLLEHMPNPQDAVGEFARIANPNGRVFILATNRFSLAPEPHVRVWGVGFLPRRWMPAYVKWRRGLAYEKKRLLSCFEVRKLFRTAGLSSLEFSLPAVTAVDWQNLRGVEKIAGLVFTLVAKIPVLRLSLLLFSPVIQALGRKGERPPKRVVPVRSQPDLSVAVTKGATVA